VKPELNTIIFDYGAVIVKIDHNLTKQAFSNLGLSDIEGYFNKVKQDGLFGEFETGNIGEPEFFDRLQELFPKNIFRKDIIHAWNTMILHVPKENLNLLEQLSKKYDLFLMSNANPTHIDLIDQKLQNAYNVDGIQPYFIKAYFSYDVHMTKPDPAFFQLLIQENDLNVSTTLFIDDALPNIEAAQELGIQTIHFTEGADNLEAALNHLL